MDPTLLMASLVLLAPSSLGDWDEPDFARDIQPLLAKHCYGCHGEEKQRAGLRLDQRDAALPGSFNGEFRVIIPGDTGSELLLRLKSDDEDERMPPKGPPLDTEKIELFERWIAAGATWPEENSEVQTAEASWTTHWAYLPPERSPVPSAPRGRTGVEPIDRFLRASMAQKPLRPRASVAMRFYPE